MQKFKHFTFGLLTVLLLAATFQALPVQAKPRSPQVIAAGFHADWCGKCKQMAPNAMKTMASYKGDRTVKFVNFDLTNDATKKQSAKLAARNGLTSVWNSYQKTGMVLLVDGKTRKVIDTIDFTDSKSEMKEKIEAAKSG